MAGASAGAAGGTTPSASAAYQEWKALLHHFYEPFPVVEHYAPLLGS